MDKCSDWSESSKGDKRYTTPSRTNKFITLSHPVCSYLLTEKMRPVRANIAKTIDKRFTLKEEQQGAQLVRKSEMVQIAPCLGHKSRLRISKQKLTLERVEELNRVFSVDIESKVRMNQKYKEKMIAKMKKIEERRNKMRCIRKRLLLIDYRKRNLFILRQYYEYLKSETGHSRGIVDHLQWQVDLSRSRADSLAADIHFYMEKLTHFKTEANQSTARSEDMSHAISMLNRDINGISRREVPEEEELIRGMFLVGILNQQIEIFSQVKMNNKGKLSKKSCPPVRIATVDQCHGYVGKFRVFTYIYMFNQSLLLPNIKALMECTPFFAEEEKRLYDYPLFFRKMGLMVHQMKGTDQVSKTKDTLMRCANTLHVCTEPEELPKIKDVLGVLTATGENDFKLGMTCIRVWAMNFNNFNEFSKQVVEAKESCLFLTVKWIDL